MHAQIVALFALAVSRAANIWPLAAMVNYVRPPELRIPQTQQVCQSRPHVRAEIKFVQPMSISCRRPVSRMLHRRVSEAEP